MPARPTPTDEPRSPKHERRSQAERRATTRQAILDATLVCLAERGYPRSTTSLIARRAGVSVGALQHHFDSKADLLTAAVDHALERRLDEFAKAMADRDPSRDAFDTAIDALWASMSGPTFVAWLELTVAARGDRVLGQVLEASDARFARATEEQFATWFGEVPGLTGDTERKAVLDITFAVLKGLALECSAAENRRTPIDVAGVVDTLKALSRLAFPREASHPESRPPRR